MKIIRNNIIPFTGFKAVNLFGVLFVRGDSRITDSTINHERIHSAQWRELLYIGFLLWYVLEWLVRLIQYRNFDKAYRNISFEREAYANKNYSDYLNERKLFSFFDYL